VKAELYALTHRGNPGDVAFYGEVCRGAKSVLELGSGSGRLLTALAGTKRRVVGLELAPELVALAKRNLRALPAAKRKSVRVLKADMRDFALPNVNEGKTENSPADLESAITSTPSRVFNADASHADGKVAYVQDWTVPVMTARHSAPAATEATRFAP